MVGNVCGRGSISVECAGVVGHISQFCVQRGCKSWQWPRPPDRSPQGPNGWGPVIRSCAASQWYVGAWLESNGSTRVFFFQTKAAVTQEIPINGLTVPRHPISLGDAVILPAYAHFDPLHTGPLMTTHLFGAFWRVYSVCAILERNLVLRLANRKCNPKLLPWMVTGPVLLLCWINVFRTVLNWHYFSLQVDISNDKIWGFQWWGAPSANFSFLLFCFLFSLFFFFVVWKFLSLRCLFMSF
jgi:hypothetical protein